ncbi:hypothetical protein [Mongoliimonas terrestris]|uniref:hypothetical protein n=1 Tax=Mongoliimonas terrestris TaxID=1709001 RepID=UPI00094951FF|nr:hypothetical protein [Mongoliimonas terrestris]
MNARDKSALDRFARRVALADALVRADDLDDEGLAALERSIAELSPTARERLNTPPSATRRLSYGLLRGELVVPDSFFDPLPEDELRAWEGD